MLKQAATAGASGMGYREQRVCRHMDPCQSALLIPCGRFVCSLCIACSQVAQYQGAYKVSRDLVLLRPAHRLPRNSHDPCTNLGLSKHSLARCRLRVVS